MRKSSSASPSSPAKSTPHFTGYLGIYQKGCISISKGAVLR